MNENEFVQGGQGRTAESLIADARGVVWCLVLAIVAMLF
jgi:hypothetical protein